MTGKNLLFVGVWASIFSTTGCVIPGYEGARLAEQAGPECEIPLTQRNQVYTFVVGGNNPKESTAMDKFRQGLNAKGYANVATGPSIYAWWMIGEMRRIHSETPNVVFIVVGLDSSASPAVKLSEKAAREGLPVHGVVIADPTGKTSGPGGGLRTLILGTNNKSAGSQEASDERNLTADPKNIADVVQLLNEVASRNPLPLNNDVVSEWVYPYAADTMISVEPKSNSEWDFMFDSVGGVTRGIADPLPPRTIAPTGNNTAVK